MNHKKELLRTLWVGLGGFQGGLGVSGLGFRGLFFIGFWGFGFEVQGFVFLGGFFGFRVWGKGIH